MMFFNWRREAFHRIIMQIGRREPRSARDQGKGSCCRSGNCCWVAPCQLTHIDLVALAAHHDLTEAQFFMQYCVVNPRPRGCYQINLRRASWEGGKYVEDSQSWDASSPCVFLDDPVNGEATCKVHDIKPLIGSSIDCTSHENPDEDQEGLEWDWTREELIALGWDGKTGDSDLDDE